MPLRITILFSVLFTISVAAKERNLTLKVEGKSYTFSLNKDKSISLKEKTIDLVIEKKPCNKELFSKFQKKVQLPLNKFESFLSQRNIEIAKCSNGGVEKEICLFLNSFPNTFQAIKVKESLLCDKSKEIKKKK